MSYVLASIYECYWYNPTFFEFAIFLVSVLMLSIIIQNFNIKW